MKNPHKGSTLDSFLKEENLFDESEATAIKRIIAFQLEQTMKNNNLSKTALAEKLHTSRAALNRILDPQNTSITLHTLIKAAHIIGKRINFSIEDIK